MILAVNRGLPVRCDEPAYLEDHFSLFDFKARRHLRAARRTFGRDARHAGLLPGLADHVHELDFDVHARAHRKHMTVDDRADAMTAGDEPFAFQHCEAVPQLGAADAKPLRQHAFTRQALAVREHPILHCRKKAGADGVFLLRRLLFHAPFPPNENRYYLKGITFSDIIRHFICFVKAETGRIFVIFFPDEEGVMGKASLIFSAMLVIL